MGESCDTLNNYKNKKFRENPYIWGNIAELKDYAFCA